MSLIDLVRKAQGLERAMRDRILSDLDQNPSNGCVGQKLVIDDERVRVWMIHLPPGGRLPLHKHVKDYIWLALTGGRARSCIITDEGVRVDEFELLPGASKFNRYGRGEFKIHDLENIGTTEIVFSVTEFGGGSNEFLPVPDSVRLNTADGVIASTLFE